MNPFAVDTIGIGADARHCRQLITVARGHEYKVPCPGQQLEVRRLWQFARQGGGVFVHCHQLVAIATVEQHWHMHVRQGMAAKHQAQRRHQHQRMDARVSLGLQVVAINHQLALGGARVAVFGAFLAVAAQTFEIRLGARQDQCRFATGGITDDADLIDIDKGRQHRIGQGGGDRLGYLDRPAIQITHGAQAAVVLIVVAGMQDRHHYEPLTHQ